MALRSTVYKAELQVSDLDRHYYQTHSLIVARHPSETDERMMVRLLAFVLNASEGLAFGKGISSDEEPALWDRDLTGQVKVWIEVGQPDERLLRKACGKADRVLLYIFGRSAELWWQNNRADLLKLPRLSAYLLSNEMSAGLARLADRNMRLQATVQEGQVWFGGDKGEVDFTPQHLCGPGVGEAA